MGMTEVYISWRIRRSETYVSRTMEWLKKWPSLGPRQTRAQAERGVHLAAAFGIGMGGLIVLMGVVSLFAK